MTKDLRDVEDAPLRTDAEQLIASLGWTKGVSLKEIIAGVANKYDKSLILQAVGDNELTTITGLWVETNETGYVFFRAADPAVYQIHSMFHEFGHILGKHQGCDVLSVVDSTTLRSTGLGKQIRRAHARGALQNEDEAFAEEIAYKLAHLILSGSTVGLGAAFE